MVAISLYRGNLHKVPDVPRQWLMPTPKISLKDFKVLLNRRSRALSRLQSTASTSNAKPNPNIKQEEEKIAEANHNRDPQNPRIDGGDSRAKPIDGSEGITKEGSCETQLNSVDTKATAAPLNHNSEANNNGDASNEKDKRKTEVEEKLQVLQARKHNLVQVLKQILNAEEELKGRSSITQAVPPLQVDVTNDSGSMTRHQMGGTDGGAPDIEPPETDIVSNHNNNNNNTPHSSHNLLRMSSTSPSSDSPHRRSAFNAGPHGSRASLGVVGSSPSRFAPTAGQIPNAMTTIPTVSASGTNYMMSSPSPAASGGTSVFRDARLPSPWN